MEEEKSLTQYLSELFQKGVLEGGIHNALMNPMGFSRSPDDLGLSGEIHRLPLNKPTQAEYDAQVAENKQKMSDPMYMAQEMAINSMPMAPAITRAQKELGNIAGKKVNQMAKEIRPPGMENLDFINLVKDFVKNPGKFKPFASVPGTAKDVFVKKNDTDFVLKKMKQPTATKRTDIRTGQTRELTKEELDYLKYHDALKEQIMMNKIGPEQAVPTQTLFTSKNAYMRQPRVIAGATYPDSRKVEEELRKRFPSLHSGEKNALADLGQYNFGYDRKTGKTLLLDAGATDRLTMTADEVKQLQNTLKKPSDMSISEQLTNYVSPKDLETLLDESKPNYINEILKLKGK